MRIVLLGATGLTGVEVVKQALAAGHKVVAYVRRPDVVEPRPGLHVIAGQLEDVEAMTSAFQGSDAVICCVGPKLDLRTIRRVDLMQRVLPSIVTVMEYLEKTIEPYKEFVARPGLPRRWQSVLSASTANMSRKPGHSTLHR